VTRRTQNRLLTEPRGDQVGRAAVRLHSPAEPCRKAARETAGPPDAAAWSRAIGAAAG